MPNYTTAVPRLEPAHSGDQPARGVLPRARRGLMGLGFLITVGVATAYVLNPNSPVAILYVLLAVFWLGLVAVAPPLRGARPRFVWLWVSVGAVCLLAAIVQLVVRLILVDDPNLGPFSQSTLYFFAGYLSFIAWLSLLCKEAGAQRGQGGITDQLAITAGAGLSVWVLFISPMLGGSTLPNIVAQAAIPVFDVALVSLAITLAVRLHMLARGLAWLIATLSLLLLLDVSSLIYSTTVGGFAPPWVRAGYLFVYFGIALCATHPTAVYFWGGTIVRGEPGTRHPTALIVFTISPAMLATAVPVADSPIDAFVRSTAVFVILVLLFVRLSSLMRALSQAEATSKARALRDELTALPNRAAAVETLEHRLDQDGARELSTAVLFMDCDDFKGINDTWGHEAGDRYLQYVATHLPAYLRDRDVLARLGGDEFVVIASVEKPEQAQEIARRAAKFFATPFTVESGQQHMTSVSIGIAVASAGENKTVTQLFKEADLAMYAAKQRGRGLWSMSTPAPNTPAHAEQSKHYTPAELSGRTNRDLMAGPDTASFPPVS